MNSLIHVQISINQLREGEKTQTSYSEKRVPFCPVRNKQIPQPGRACTKEKPPSVPDVALTALHACVTVAFSLWARSAFAPDTPPSYKNVSYSEKNAPKSPGRPKGKGK